MKSVIVSLMLLASFSAEAQSPFAVISTTASIINTTVNLSGSRKTYQYRVDAVGGDYETAKTTGFKKAVERTISVVVSEAESDGKRLSNNTVIAYSSGYVEDFKIISNDVVNGKTHLVMDVWVSDSKIAERALALEIKDGDRINRQKFNDDWERERARYTTGQQRTGTAKQIITAILNDYNRMAYRFNIKKSYISNNQLILEVDMEMNQEYVDALADAVKSTSEIRGERQPYNVRIQTGHIFGGENGGWADKSIQQMFVDTFSFTDKKIKVDFPGTGMIQCYRYDLSKQHGFMSRPNGWDEGWFVVSAKFYKRIEIRTNHMNQSQMDSFVRGLSRAPVVSLANDKDC
jgi:hypothetical protein